MIGALKRQRWPGAKQPWREALKDSRAWAYLTMKPGEDPTAALVSEFAALWFDNATDPQRVARRNEWTKLLRKGGAGLADLIETTDKRFRDELALAPPPRLFLYIDQGEELYARSPPTERKRFSEIIADGLARSPQRLIVMTSQRADYYGELLDNKPLFTLAEKIDVPSLDADNLALVLREPARVLGVGFESDDLVSHIVKSAEDQPGALPLLADLFTDLWERMRERGDGTLRMSDRREIIQVGAALSKRADQFLVQNPDKVEAVKRLFTLRLAYVPRQGEPVRARWERDARGEADQAVNAEWALVDLLAGPDWRLLVTGEKDGKATAEVAHEILFKTWPSLKGWLEDEREFLIWRGELEARQKEYEKAGKEGAGRQSQALLMGLPLNTAEKWLETRRPDIDPAAQDFIAASQHADRAVTRRWKWLQGTVVLLLVGLIGVLLARMYEPELRELVFWWTTFRGHALRAADVLTLKPGQPFAECIKIWSDDQKTHQIRRYCPNMVVVPSGTFMMGGEFHMEQPVHEVTIAQPFAVSKFAVTFDQWDACVSGGGCDNLRPSGLSWGRGIRPVLSVNWANFGVSFLVALR